MLTRAKINLHLHITGRAENGYHLLDSLVAFTSIADDIQITPSDKFQLNITGNTNLSAACAEQDNLITRVTRLLAEHQDIQPHVQINLTKNIPLAGGLGGGSADAAATLLLLQDIWNISSDDIIQNIATKLGSDIVACLYNGPVIMRDTGNTILPAPTMPEIYGVLVNPNVACSTPEVYQIYAQSNQDFSEDIQFPEMFSSINELTDFLNQHTRNDLTDAAIKVAPVIRTVLDELADTPDCLLARLSGSGATCYGLFETDNKAQEASLKLKTLHPEWWIAPTIINKI